MIHSYNILATGALSPNCSRVSYYNNNKVGFSQAIIIHSEDSNRDSQAVNSEMENKQQSFPSDCLYKRVGNHPGQVKPLLSIMTNFIFIMTMFH